MLTQAQWQQNILRAAHLADTGDGYSLRLIAQTLADADTAREVLIAHFHGDDDCSLLDLVAEVVEMAARERGD
jgi:hypothetical protein